MSNVEPLSGAAFNAMMEEESKESLIAMLFKEWREKDASRARSALMREALEKIAHGKGDSISGHLPAAECRRVAEAALTAAGVKP